MVVCNSARSNRLWQLRDDWRHVIFLSHVTGRNKSRDIARDSFVCPLWHVQKVIHVDLTWQAGTEGRSPYRLSMRDERTLSREKIGMHVSTRWHNKGLHRTWRHSHSSDRPMVLSPSYILKWNWNKTLKQPETGLGLFQPHYLIIFSHADIFVPAIFLVALQCSGPSSLYYLGYCITRKLCYRKDDRAMRAI